MTDSIYRAASGTLYAMTQQGGVIRSADGISWNMIEGSPHGRAIIGDGTTLFTSNRGDSDKLIAVLLPGLPSPGGTHADAVDRLIRTTTKPR